MPWRVSFRFVVVQAKIAGWTENFWHQSETLSDVEGAVVDLRPLLLAVHGVEVANTSYRFTYVAPAGSPPVLRKGKPVSTGEANNPQATADMSTDYATNALLLQWKSGSDYRVTQWIKGIPDDCIADGGKYKPSSAYAKRVKSLVNYLASGVGWCMRVQNHAMEGKRITSLSNTGLVTVPSHGYAQGDRIRISGITSYRNVNHIWPITVDPGDPNTFQLNMWQNPPTGTVLFGPNPKATKQSATLVSPDLNTSTTTGVSVLRATSHKVGRPFDLLGGRRSHRRS